MRRWKVFTKKWSKHDPKRDTAKDNDVLLMRDVQGMKFREIAAVMGVCTQAIQRRYHKAKARQNAQRASE